MASSPPSMEPAAERALETLLSGALLLDLETAPDGRVLKVGALLGDQAVSGGAGELKPRLWAALTEMAGRASCILGHNLLRHDLPAVHALEPRHPLLQLPVIDTLLLSPLAFPENPYHRLVKDYKLVSESVNDPVADARQAAGLFQDEFKSFHGMRQTEPRLFELLHFLLAEPDRGHEKAAAGFELVFTALGGSRPGAARALDLCKNLLPQWACSHAPVESAQLASAPNRLALAYALTWLRVAGGNSVLPPWVRLDHPAVAALLHRLREVPCGAADCAYCLRAHDPLELLRSFFVLPDFRAQPTNAAGGSLQLDIVQAGLRGESLLAILPTGGGKSLCFQLPALARNFRRGQLTIVISPLQALMKDQVDGMVRRTGTPSAAALFGLLTPPERGDVLRRIRLGDVAVLYVSPEQLRNRSFREAIAHREIGCWVFDEAHCLSKWGHDFRPDYLYAGRFISEFARTHSHGLIPPIACFTATAKQDVKQEILAFFKSETNRDLILFEGGVERQNLRFEVQTITTHEKLERLHDLLSVRLGRNRPGSAVVFRAKRLATRETAEYLIEKGWRAAHFHAGLTPPEKKRVQDEFLAGEVQVICATNAFGMGIDKDDVRLVVHADTPGSLENYLQEAGRAGRDGQTADCILLFNEADCEDQFRMGARSELSRRDLAQILRSLRKAARRHGDQVVITTGEILRDEDLEVDIDVEGAAADTKVRTAISWLERAGFIQRDENMTQVFQARLLVRTLAEAETKMAGLKLSNNEQVLWIAILRELMNADRTQALTVDQLALLPEFAGYSRPQPGSSNQGALREEPIPYGERIDQAQVSAKILRVLRNMSQAGLLKRDMLLNAFLRHKVADHSRARLDQIMAADRAMIDLLAIEDPDPEGWVPLSLRLLNQRLHDQNIPSSVEQVRQLLKSLGEDGRGFAGTHGSIELRHVSRDTCRARIRRSWTLLSELADKRRRAASLLLDVLRAKVPAEVAPKADVLVEFSFDELRAAVESDLLLRAELKDIDVAIERALMFLHENHVIILQQGLAVFRSAMTIRLRPEAKKERYKPSDYQPLQHHYRERIFQVHVMSEYARRGLERMREALALVLAYFSADKESFIRRFLKTKPELLEQATTAQSFQRIVTDLGHPAQIKIVTAPLDRNMLVLAGPGSGKTQAVVHRCAYLLRVQRVPAKAILVCCFNRQAATELRRRLNDLAGSDARGVTVLTYHGLALRLLGYSLAGRSHASAPELDFDALIANAAQLLRGDQLPPGLEPGDAREHLLAGFQHILVDEYQDIDAPQYELISAMAGRTLDDADLKLSLMAVGDDDQNIYSFRGAHVAFIRRFHEDYAAEVHYLVENFRSTRCIIDAANQLIAENQDRMKGAHPIRIDRRRQADPPGGSFSQTDSHTLGKVLVIEVPDENAQAIEAVAEFERLSRLGVPWENIALLARSHRDLAQVRTVAEQHNIPVRWWAERSKLPPLQHIREIRAFLARVSDLRTTLCRPETLIQIAEECGPPNPANPWSEFRRRMLEAWQAESSGAEVPAQEALEFFYEFCAESRRDFSCGEGVTLSTVHAAKGTEHDHVLLVGAWPLDRRPDELRRLFYVGMTRARKTLAVLDQLSIRPSLPQSLAGPQILRHSPPQSAHPPTPRLDYAVLGLEDLNLSYPGFFEATHPIHRALDQLQPGALLSLSRQERSLDLLNHEGTPVARLSRKAEETWRERLGSVRQIRVLALVQRTSDQHRDPARQERCRVDQWEVPMAEIIWEEPPGSWPNRP